MTRTLLFDCDGVLADTERDGHLVAFNRMWREEGVNWQWNLIQYADKVKIGGGKERMASLGRDEDFRAVYDVPAAEDAWWETVARWHKRKSEIYKEMIAGGALPGRPGVRRIAEEAWAAGWRLAVCSTSSLSWCRPSLITSWAKRQRPNSPASLPGTWPRPETGPGHLSTGAGEAGGARPADCLVVEDSRNGLLAATAAGLPCVITVNELTRNEDFHEAAIVVSSLGDPNGEPMVVLENRTKANPQSFMTVQDLEAIRASVEA